MHQLVRKLTKLATLTTLLTLALPAVTQTTPVPPSATGAIPPKTWIDKDTGHRIVRVTDEPNSTGFYFNVNAYTPDLKTMIYTAPDGIHTYDLATHKTRLLVPNPPRPADDGSQQFRFGGVHAIIAGRVTNSVFYTMADPTTHVTAIYKADVYTGAITKLTDLPQRHERRHHQRRRDPRRRHHQRRSQHRRVRRQPRQPSRHDRLRPARPARQQRRR